MQLNYKFVVRTFLILLALTTISLSLIDVQIPPMGKYWNAFPKMASFMIHHPQESMEIMSYFQGEPELFDWVLQHSNELYNLYSNDEIINLFSKNPWLFKFIRRICSSDPEYFQELTLDPEKSIKLLTWLVDHPEHRETLYENPSLARKLIDSGYDESLFTSIIKIIFPIPYFVVFENTPINVTVYSPKNIKEVKLEWNNTKDSGKIDYWKNLMGNLSTLWNTSNRTPGAYTINAIATTGNGTAIKDSVNIIVLTRNRVQVEILSPRNDQIISGSLSIVTRVKNQSRIDNCYTILKGNNASYPFNLLGPNEDSLYFRDVDTGLVIDGRYNLTVVAIDEDGFANSSSILISISDIPQIHVVSPKNNSILSGNFIISANVTSVDTIISCTANLTSKYYTYLFFLAKTDGLYSQTVNTNAIVDGEYNLSVIAIDSDGSRNSSTIAITISNPPKIKIIEPNDGEIISGNVTISARVESFDPVIRCYVNLTGARICLYNLTDLDSDGVYDVVINTATIFDDYYNLTVTALDADGSVSSSSILIRVYDVPQITITSPQNGETIGGNFTVLTTVTSVDEISQCYATLNNSTHSITQTLTQTQSKGIYTTSFDTKTISDGEYTLSVFAIDIDGSNASAQITVKVSNIPTIEILIPSDGSGVYGEFNVMARIGAYRSISSCNAIISNATTSRVFTLSDEGGGVFSGLADSSLFSDGVYNLNVSVIDSLDSQNSTQITVKIDNVPNVKIVLPEDDVFIQGNFTIRAHVSSLNLLSKVVAMIDDVDSGNLTDPDGDGVFDLVYNLYSLSEGSHTVYVKAFNSQGYYNTTSTRTIKVDNLASTIVFVHPVNESSFSEDVTVIANISDYADSVEWYVNYWLVETQYFNNTYVSTVEYTVDISKILFPPNVMVVKVKYTSALGHSDISDDLILYKE